MITADIEDTSTGRIIHERSRNSEKNLDFLQHWILETRFRPFVHHFGGEYIRKFKNRNMQKHLNACGGS